MKNYYTFFVTAACNFQCHFCNQHEFKRDFQDKDMSLDNLEKICYAIKETNTRSEIALSGGEPTLWSELEEGCKIIKDICGKIIKLNTNCTNYKQIDRLLQDDLVQIVFTNSANCHLANAKSLKKKWKRRVCLNMKSGGHKKPPVTLAPNSLPAKCGCDKAAFMGDWAVICPNFYSNIRRIGHSTEEYYGRQILSIHEDWYTSFQHIDKRNMQICQYCLANAKVWDRL